MSCEGGEVKFDVTLDTTKATAELYRVQQLLQRSLTLISRLTGNEEIDGAIMKIQRMIGVLNMLRLTMIALHAASGPVGWALAAIGVIGAGLSAGELLMGSSIEIDSRGYEY